ncbi:hypothetical protein [Massilia horti]|uniref:Uncharacterized protein n=1 Tax=Massilia horti TaxID=2562153 RepID=A0A4Y9SYJ1_9BURK|nr:hypothetical protein [Massilia horti]TFW30284.1 hypothetical protein E4O92_17220 [Massilia horti]
MHSAAETMPPPAAAGHAIWNPAAAACWSIVFTPAFGAYLVMRNWQALGEDARARAARKGWLFSLGLLSLELLSSALNSRLNSESNFMPWIGVAWLLVWSLTAALPQARAVRARLGPDYPRRQWDPVLFAAVIAGTGYVLLRALFTFMFVALT